MSPLPVTNPLGSQSQDHQSEPKENHVLVVRPTQIFKTSEINKPNN